MNFLRLTIFSDIFMIFEEFLETKMAKRGYFAWDPHGADVVKIKEKWSPHPGDRGPLILC